MVRYYTYRLNREYVPLETSKMKIQDVPIPLSEKDVFLVFVSGSLSVFGIYEKEGDYLVLKNKIKGKKLSDYYSCFSMINEITDRTYKMFAKRIREIEKDDIEKIKGTLKNETE